MTARNGFSPYLLCVAVVVLLPLSGCSTTPGRPALAAPPPVSGADNGTSPSAVDATSPSAVNGTSPSASDGTPRSDGAPKAAGLPASSSALPKRRPGARTRTAPDRFGTLPPGSTLPSGAECAEWVRARPYPENKGVNARANQTTGHSIGNSFFVGDDPRANTQLAPRVNGQFTGTTQEILRWTACKWGIDEDIVLAQAATESWWRMDALGDWTDWGSRCAPGRPLGADGRPGECPESFGILQVRYPYAQPAWSGMANSTAMNAEVAYAMWRTCFEGYSTWLNNTGRGNYAAGDAWGCVGRGGSGAWYSRAAEDYIGRVRSNLDQRIWLTPNFQEP